ACRVACDADRPWIAHGHLLSDSVRVSLFANVRAQCSWKLFLFSYLRQCYIKRVPSRAAFRKSEQRTSNSGKNGRYIDSLWNGNSQKCFCCREEDYEVEKKVHF